jgi:ATP-dependent DNA helicase RecG
VVEITVLISRGKGKTLEFKESLPQGDKLAKTVVAFSNTAGGKILIGVKDNGKLIGVPTEVIHETQDQIANILHDSVSPVVLPEIYT